MPIRTTPPSSHRPPGLSEAEALEWDQRVQIAVSARIESDRLQAEQERLRAMPPEYVLTLVHGTRLPFTRKAEWISPDSGLAKGLTERLGWRVAVEPFDWGGAESAVKLRAHLTAIREEKKYGGARHVVIAHSHGGNLIVVQNWFEELKRLVPLN